MVLLCFVFREKGGMVGGRVAFRVWSSPKATALSTLPVPFLGSPFDQPSQTLTEALCLQGGPVLGTTPKASLALGVCHAWLEAEGTWPASCACPLAAVQDHK